MPSLPVQRSIIKGLSFTKLTPTIDWRWFADPAPLVNRKRERRLSISVGIPTLSEEGTIASIVSTIRRELMERYPLVDEVGVIDSGSTDLARERAREVGAQVYHSDQYLPALGERWGKGENLWKSLLLLGGDLLVWVDGDIRDFGPRSICGLLGPLLEDGPVRYTTAYYRHPFLLPDRNKSYEGGRATEPLGRPLLSALLPEPAGLFQPFAGEHAGYRTTLERIPFFVGYGVDIGLFLGILRLEGKQAISHVNLGERLHRNLPLAELSLQAFGVLQTILKRAHAFDHISLHQQWYMLMRPEDPPGEANPAINEYPLLEEERPPMIQYLCLPAALKEVRMTTGIFLIFAAGMGAITFWNWLGNTQRTAKWTLGHVMLLVLLFCSGVLLLLPNMVEQGRIISLLVDIGNGIVLFCFNHPALVSSIGRGLTGERETPNTTEQEELRRKP